MKIDLGNLTIQAVPHVRGGFYVRETKRGPIAQKWPVGNKKTETFLQWAYRQRFAFAARMASTPVELELQTAIEMAKGTEQVPRDILTMMAMGRYYIFQNEDGTEWEPFPLPYQVAPEPPETGDIMWIWSSPQTSFTAGYWSGNFATKGNVITPVEDTLIRGIRFVANWNTAGSYIGGIYEVTGGNQILSIPMKAAIVPPGTGKYAYGIDADATLLKDQQYAILLTRTDQGTTHNLQITFPNTIAWQHASYFTRTIFGTNIDPNVGDTLSNGSNAAAGLAILV